MGVVSRVKVPNGEDNSSHSLMQGCSPRGEIWRKQAANLRPEEHEPYIRLFAIGWVCLTKRSPNTTRRSECKWCGLMEWKLFVLPREISQTWWNEVWVTVEKDLLWEVSRDHSTGCIDSIREGSNLKKWKKMNVTKWWNESRKYRKIPACKEIGRNPKRMQEGSGITT